MTKNLCVALISLCLLFIGNGSWTKKSFPVEKYNSEPISQPSQQAGLSHNNPIIRVDSTQLNITLSGCNDSLIVPLKIYNDGETELQYHFSGGTFGNSGPSSLDSVRVRLNASFQEITNLLPNFFEFFEGDVGQQIFDGGNDMYDGGNFLSVNNSSNFLEYSNDGIISNSELGEGGRYFTRKYPGLFVFAADIDAISSFDIRGDLGADGQGMVSATEFSYNHHGITYQGFVKKVHDAFDPSVHHLIIVKNAQSASHTFDNTTLTDDHTIIGIEDAERIYYLLFAETNSTAYSDELMEEVMIRFLEITETASLALLPDGDFFLGANQVDTIDLLFTSTNFNSGIYQQNILINSNDPIIPQLAIQATVTVLGEPAIEISAGCLDFPPIMEFTTGSLPLTITNTGCDTLLVSQIMASQAVFSTSLNQAILEPGEMTTISVFFSPEESGEFTAELTLTNNAMPVNVCLTATSFEAPLISTTPNNFTVDLVSCADSLTLPLTVLNNGDGNLSYRFTSGSATESGNTLDSVRYRLNQSFSEITGLLPNLFEFFDGETGISIIDGGNDMYDGGNFITVNNSFNYLPYSNEGISSTTELGPNGQYFTRKFPGLFVFAADLNNVTSFNISGDLGADGSGFVSGTTLTYNQNGIPYKGYVKKVYGAFDPSVHHLIIVRDMTGISQSFENNTNSDAHNLEGLNITKRIYYLLFSEASGDEYSDAQIRQVMIAFLDLVESSGFVLLPDGEFTLAPSENQTFDLTFTSLNTEGGVYEQVIVIGSNDPMQPNLSIPVTVNVSFDLCAGFEFDQPIPCGGAVNFFSTTVNTPTDILWDFGDGDTSIEENPTHIYDAPGSFEVILTVANAISADTFSQVVNIEEVSAPVETCEVMGNNNFPYLEITEFSLNTIFNISDISNASYSDFTCEFSTELVVGVDYPFSIESESFNNQDIKLWLDLNNDGVFSSSELLAQFEDADPPYEGVLTIPATATAIGIPLRLRVGTDDDFYTLLPCTPSNAGEFEDYTIFLQENTMAPVANFSVTILDECQGAVQLTDLSTNLPTSWQWNFGDGTTSTTQNPIHIFEQAGIYTVSLISSNNFGSDTHTAAITINALNPMIEVLSPPVINEPISFSAMATGAISWLWNFGDGTSSNAPTPSHTYTDPGQYTVTLTTSNGIGCQATTTLIIDVLISNTEEIERYFTVYPNPASELIYIRSNTTMQETNIQLYAMDGRLVKNRIIDKGSQDAELIVKDLPQGPYWIKIGSPGKVTTLKVLVLRK